MKKFIFLLLCVGAVVWLMHTRGFFGSDDSSSALPQSAQSSAVSTVQDAIPEVYKQAHLQAQNTQTGITTSPSSRTDNQKTDIAINRYGAQQLRMIFQTILEQQKEALVSSMGFSVLYDGDITVEIADRYYAVTLPQTKVMFRDGRIFDLGMISLNAIPMDQKNDIQPAYPVEQGSAPDLELQKDQTQYWNMTIALPVPMVMSDKDGNILHRIDIGQQRTSAVWSVSEQKFVTYKGVYKNVYITDGHASYAANFPQLTLKYLPNSQTVQIENGDSILTFALDSLFKKVRNY